MRRVLITGAARGIGQATASRLAAAGWDVIAGVRQLGDAQLLVGAHPNRITPVMLDITDDDHLAALEGALPAALDAVVNNAGVVVGGPIEAVALSALRRQLEVNVVAQAAVTQAVLPRVRKSRGRVVFVSSLSGRVATPMLGAYNASKFAVEGMADAMRMELAPWGIRVALVEPAQTDTDVWRRADDELNATVAALSPHHRDLYAKHIAGSRRTISRSLRMAASVDGAAGAIEKALTDRRPRARYVVGTGPRVQAFLSQVMPTPVLDVLIRTGSGVPRRA